MVRDVRLDGQYDLFSKGITQLHDLHTAVLQRHVCWKEDTSHGTILC